MRPIVDLEDYEGHGTHWKAHFFEDGSVAVGGVCKLFTEETGYRTRKMIKANALLIQDAPRLVLEIKRLHEEIKLLSKYRDIVEKYDDALLGDGDTDPRWSELFD